MKLAKSLPPAELGIEGALWPAGVGAAGTLFKAFALATFLEVDLQTTTLWAISLTFSSFEWVMTRGSSWL